MVFSYTGKPSTNSRDRVRLLLGDTDKADPKLQDDEVDYFISENGSARMAAADGADAIAAQFASLVSETVGQVRMEYETLMEHYSGLAKTLRTQASRAGLGVYAGGLSVSEKEALPANEDSVQPKFTRETHNTEGFTQTNPFVPRPPGG